MNDEQAPTAGDAQPDSVFNTHGVPRNPSTRFSGALPVEADPSADIQDTFNGTIEQNDGPASHGVVDNVFPQALATWS